MNKYPSVPPKTLAVDLSTTDLVLKLTDIVDWGGNDLTTASFSSDYIPASLINDAGTRIEFILINSASIVNGDTSGATIFRRGLPYFATGVVATDQTSVAANKLEWTAGETKVLLGSHPPYLLSRFANKDNNETVGGLFTFPNDANTPQLGTVYAAPTLDLQAASKKYVDDIAIAGAPDASPVTKGITKLSVAAVLATNPISVGDNDPRVPTQSENDALVGDNGTPSSTNTYVTQTGFQRRQEVFGASTTGNDTYVVTLSPVPVAYVDGMEITVKPDTSNTAASSLNVNGLGAVTIKKNNNADTETGDILVNQPFTVQYNSTGPVFKLQTPSAATMSTANSNTLTAGATSNADALHTHTFNKAIATTQNVTLINITTVAQNILSVTIPGGTLSTNRQILVRFVFLTQSGTDNTLDITALYGGTAIGFTRAQGSAGAGTNLFGTYEAVLSANGATGAQIGTAVCRGESTGSSLARTTVSQTISRDNPLAIDSTVNQTLAVTIVGDNAVGTGTIITNGISVEIIQ